MTTKYNGSDAIINIETTPSSGTYQVVGCQRALSLTINSEEIDVTGKCDMPDKELLTGGVKSMAVSFGGLLDDTAGMDQILGAVGSILNFEIEFGHGTYTGAFHIASAELTGEYTDAQQFSMTLNSSGTIAFA